MSVLPIFALAAWLLLGAAFQDPPAADTRAEEEVERREKISELLQKVLSTEDLGQKESYYRQILGLDPYHVGALQGLEQVRERMAREEQVQQQRRQEEIDKTEALKLAREAYLQGNLAEASAQLETVLKLAPGSPDALNLQALIERDQQSQRLTWILGASAAGVVVLGVGALLLLRLRRREGVLEILDGLTTGEVFPLQNERTTLGAQESDVDVLIHDPGRRISRRHCAVVRAGKHYFLTDQSTNGTFLNGRRLNKGEPVLLRGGDEISLSGEVRVRFRYR